MVIPGGIVVGVAEKLSMIGQVFSSGSPGHRTDSHTLTSQLESPSLATTQICTTPPTSSSQIYVVLSAFGSVIMP